LYRVNAAYATLETGKIGEEMATLVRSVDRKRGCFIVHRENIQLMGVSFLLITTLAQAGIQGDFYLNLYLTFKRF
jgi:hypothetical protein